MVDIELTDNGLLTLLVDGKHAPSALFKERATAGDVERLVKKASEFDSPFAATYAIGIRTLLESLND